MFTKTVKFSLNIMLQCKKYYTELLLFENKSQVIREIIEI